MTTLPQTTNIRVPRPAGGGLAVPGAMGGGVAAAAGMTAGDVWRVIRAHIPLIIFALFLGAGIGLGANYYCSRHYSRYTATGLVQITERRTRGISEGGG